MRNRLYLILVVLFPILTFGQVERSLLKGKIVADSLEVGNITVNNKTANVVTMTDANGNFRLMAQEKDTLIFSGVSFHSSFLVVSHSHMMDDDLTIRLKVKINALDEIIVRPYTITGNLETDTEKLKVKTIDLNLGAIDLSLPNVQYSPVDNALKSTMGVPGNAFNGINFIQLGERLEKLLFKSKPKPVKIEYITDKIFSDAVKEKFSQKFFTENLKLQPEQIDLFLVFCDDGSPESRALLNPKKEFELIDYLLKKSEEYLKKNQ